MSIGPLVNGAAILLGGIAGAFLGRRVPRRIGERLPLVFGCVAIGLGISMIAKAATLPPVVLALILGTILGEAIQIERLFRWIASARGAASTPFRRKSFAPPTTIRSTPKPLSPPPCCSASAASASWAPLPRG